MAKQLPPKKDTQQLLSAIIAIGELREPDQIAQAILSLGTDVLGFPTGIIMLLVDDQCFILGNQGLSEKALRALRQICSQKKTKSRLLQMCSKGKALGYSDLTATAANPVFSILRQEQIASVICKAVPVPENVWGVMLVGRPDQALIEDTELEIFETLTQLLSTSLKNTWLHTQAQIHRRELEAITNTAYAIASNLDSIDVVNRILHDVLVAMRSETAILMILDQYHHELECVAATGAASEMLQGVKCSLNEGTVGWVAQNAKPLLINKYEAQPAQQKNLIRSSLSVPLYAHEQLIGVLEVQNKKQAQFTSNDQRVLEALANFAALALENVRALEERNQQTEQATLYALDLSTTYKREREQREALDQLRYSFLNVVGHELKTPLTVILQGLETLKNPHQSDLRPDQLETIDMVEQQSNYLERLIDGVITFATFSSKQNKMTYEEIQFDAVLDDAIALATFKARPKNISIDDRRAPSLPLVHIDKEQITEAILHLTDNAIKFSPTDSTIVLQAHLEETYLVLDVIDQGQGIAADHLDRIWDSFTQLNTTIERGLEGLGLGLAMTRYIVEAHQGQVSVKSNLNRGSMFTIKLPYIKSDEQQP